MNVTNSVSHSCFSFGIVIILQEKYFSICKSNTDSISPLITVLHVSFCADTVIILKFKYMDKICQAKRKIWLFNDLDSEKERNLLCKFSLPAEQIFLWQTLTAIVKYMDSDCRSYMNLDTKNVLLRKNKYLSNTIKFIEALSFLLRISGFLTTSVSLFSSTVMKQQTKWRKLSCQTSFKTKERKKSALRGIFTGCW